MKLRILSSCIERFKYSLPVLVKPIERWRLSDVSLPHSCLAATNPDRRFCSSTITTTACDAVQKVPSDIRGASRSSTLDNPLLLQNPDLDHLDENWVSLLENCACHLSSLSDDQLEILLRNIISVKSKIDRDDLLKFTFAIDREFSKRAPSWTIELALVYFELYCNLPRLRRTDFVHHILKYKQSKIFRRDVYVVTKFMRLMNKHNFWNLYHVCKFDYEIYFNNNLTKLSISDLEVFLEFMVKVDLVVNTPNLFQQFCEFVLDKLPELSSFGVSRFCKILHVRRAVGFDKDFIDSVVVEKLFHRMEKCENLQAVAYIEAASFCSEKSLVDGKFYPQFIQKFTQQLCDLSLHQLAEGMKWLTHFDDKSKNAAVYGCVVNHLRVKSLDEITHPKDFILTMFYLSRVGIYPEDLLDMLFSPKFLAQAYPKGLTRYPLRDYHVTGEELLTIDGGIEIECPDYEGNRLDMNVRHNILRYYCWKVPTLLSANYEDVNFEELLKFSRSSSRMLYTTKLALEKILGGAEFVHVGYLLPHLPRPNLLFAMSKERKPVPLTSAVCKMIVDPSTLDRNLEWYTFGIYAFGDRGSGNEDGGLRAEEIPKVRQLKKLGFNVLKLMHKEWSDKSEMEIEQSLRNKIYRHTESKLVK